MDTATYKIITLLKEKRNELARSLGEEPYKILQNAVIERIAEALPRTRADLLLIKGIGEKKADKFGALILRVVQEAQDEKKTESGRGEEQTLSVAEFLADLNRKLRDEEAVVSGEVFGAVNRRGNANYFTLKDKREEAVLSCFAWQFVMSQLGIALEEGMEVQVLGHPEIWKPTGRFSFRAQEIFLTGEGALKRAFEALKQKLAAEGLFDPDRKKPFPRFPERIGLLTAAGREAQTDFLTHLAKRGISVSLYDVRVEGPRAVGEITEAITWFNQYRPHTEVLVLTRGGGGLESLQVFNTEAIARAIFSSKIPILSAVGHEKDVTIADCVADGRASTPTHAAQLLSEAWEEGSLLIHRFQENFSSSAAFRIQDAERRIETFTTALCHRTERTLREEQLRCRGLTASLLSRFQEMLRKWQRLEALFLTRAPLMIHSQARSATISLKNMYTSLLRGSSRGFTASRLRLQNIEQKFLLASPEFKLKQGFSIVWNAEKTALVKSVDQIAAGDTINVKFWKGGAEAKVENVDA